MELKLKDTITSLELLEKINYFRGKEGRKELAHRTLLGIIREEFQEEINEQKFLPVEYKDKKGELRPMFALTLSQAKQVLVRESRTVRRAVIKYIEKMEQTLIVQKTLFNPKINLPITAIDEWNALKYQSNKLEKIKKEISTEIHYMYTAIEKLNKKLITVISLNDGIKIAIDRIEKETTTALVNINI